MFIADEIVPGFGRTGKWFALDHWKIEPDIISFAKGITSAYIPLGGIGITDRVFKALAEVPPERRWMHAYTYSAHPMACAVALTNIDIIEREGLIEAAAQKGARLLKGLQQLASRMPWVKSAALDSWPAWNSKVFSRRKSSERACKRNATSADS